MTWLTELTGVERETPQHVRQQLSVEGDSLVCPNGKRLAFGQLDTPTLQQLRSKVADVPPDCGGLQMREVVGDVRRLHADADNANALFQVASQFNLLEMASPSATPELGVGIYEGDRTQGPACAISCGAGTIYRNYFVPVGDGCGQSAEHQLDCSADLGALLGNRGGRLWKMQNGYLFPSDAGLEEISAKLQNADDTQRDRYRASLRVGLQWNAAVTLAGASHRVSQAYCSALPVAYGRQPTSQWTDFAKLVLEAAYEATFCAAIINAANTGSSRLFLTRLGGGVFGNDDVWIIEAIHRAAVKYKDFDLDVAIVSYGSSQPSVARLVERLSCS